MKVVLIGGSSPSTPVLFDYLAQVEDLPPLEIVLAGRSRPGLEAVARVARLLAGRRPITVCVAVVEQPGWNEALAGADVVVLQARIGGYQGRAFDETFPLEFGVCGDQGLGPGGLAAAWASWPVLERFVRQTRELAPRARLLFLSAPVGIFVRLARRIAPELTAWGICELPWTTLQGVCRALGVPAEGVEFEYFGLHHVGWIYRAVENGRDLVAEFAAARQAADGFPAPALLRRCRAIPTKYLRLHYEPEAVLREQRHVQSDRSRFLDQYRRRAHHVFGAGSADDVRQVLAERSAAWYPQAVGPLLMALGGVATTVPCFLSAANGDAVHDLAPDDIVELPHTVRGGRLQRRVPGTPVPHELVEIVRRFLRFERQAADAVLLRDPHRLADALRVHPWIEPSCDVARMVDKLMCRPPGD